MFLVSFVSSVCHICLICTLNWVKMFSAFLSINFFLVRTSLYFWLKFLNGLCKLCFCRGNSLIFIWNRFLKYVDTSFWIEFLTTHCDMSCLQIVDSYKQHYTVESQTCERHCSGCWHFVSGCNDITWLFLNWLPPFCYYIDSFWLSSLKLCLLFSEVDCIHNSSVKVLFCIFVLNLTVVWVLNPGRSPIAPLAILVCWSSVAHQVKYLVIGVVFE